MIVLALCVWWASLGMVLRFGGWGGVAVFSIVVLPMPLWAATVERFVRGRISDRTFGVVIALGIAALAVVLLVIYPQINTSAMGTGSDDDDALNIAARALLSGTYPYSEPTYLGNPVAPLPGAVLLAIPLVGLMGSSAYQALLWIPLFILVIRFATRDAGLTLLVAALTFVPSLAVVQSIASGTSGFVNGIYVALLSLAVVRFVPDESTPAWHRVAWTALWGISLSSRAMYAPIAVLVLVAWQLRTGWAYALRYGAVASMAGLAITLPFYIYSPDGFTPIHTGDKLTIYGAISPVVGLAMFAVSTLAGVVMLRRKPDITRFFHASTIAVGIPVFALSLIYIALHPTDTLGIGGFSSYMLEVLPFAVLYVGFSIGGGCSRTGDTSPLDVSRL